MNDHARWTTVDDYLIDRLIPSDPALTEALAASDAAGLPSINVSPAHGKLLEVLARGVQARSILEIGTLGGYSTIWLARALPPGGKLVTLELEARHAEVARANFARAGFSDRIEVRVGPALDSLARLVAEKAGPFDFIFIDADKQTYPEYFAWSMRLARRGTMILADNIVRDGAVAESKTNDERVRGVQRFHEAVGADRRVSATAIQTVGSKGYDGFSLAVVVTDP
jgi:predicted O-methyltransferase YrrM